MFAVFNIGIRSEPLFQIVRAKDCRGRETSETRRHTAEAGLRPRTAAGKSELPGILPEYAVDHLDESQPSSPNTSLVP